MTAVQGGGGLSPLPPGLIAEVAATCGRGYTVLCTVADTDLLAALAAAAGPTGLVLALGTEPPPGKAWSAVRCRPDLSIPMRSHVVDLAVITDAPDPAGLSEEVRRALAPGADVRVVTRSPAENVEEALSGASISALRTTGWDGVHLIAARGP